MNCKEPSHDKSKRFYGALCDLQKRSDFERQLQVAQKCLKGNLEEMIDNLDDMHPAFLSCGLLGPVRLDKIHETIHTSLIAWFLNPNECHGFKKTIVIALLKSTDDYFKFGQIEIDSINSEALFRDDKRRIDIRIEGKVDSKPWALYLEAKLWSDESKNQLSSYDKLIEKQQKMNKRKKIFRVFLTPYGDSPKTGGSDQWNSMSYSEMAAVFWGAGKNQNAEHGYHVLRLYLASLLKDILKIPLPLKNNSKSIPYTALKLLSKPKK